jgi:uncharacterized protein (DUF2336 family)
MAFTLTESDVLRLMKDSSGTSRAETAAKVAQQFSQTELTDKERELAHDILKLMVKDAEVRVREALSQNLADSSSMPRDIAVALAKDVDSVAMPVLELSQILTDQDLIEIVQSQGQSKQMAVARRATVSAAVSDALVDTGNENVVSTLVANDGADISESTMNRVVDNFPASDGVKSALIGRVVLPVTVAERLVTLVSDKLKDQLAQRHKVSSESAIDLILAARERAVLNLSTETDENSLDRMVSQMHRHGRLTPSIVLRALCLGDLAFFEAAIARLADLSLVNARKLIYDEGKRGLGAIYQRASLPPGQLPIARAAIAIARDLQYDGEANDRERFKRRMVDRILTQYDFLGADFDPNDIEYLLAKVGAISSSSSDDTDAAEHVE